MAKMSYQEAWELAQRLRPTLKLQNAISFADLPIKTPEIDYYEDGDSFLDPSVNRIHIGVFGLVDHFGVETAEQFKNASDYMQGHEEQHKRSTADRPYGLGIKRGCEVAIEHFAKELGYTGRFRNDADYEWFVNKWMKDQGVRLNFNALHSIVGGIMNSLEDGRIERIRSNRFPGYADLRLYHRGRFWQKQRPAFKKYDDIKDDDGELLRITMNQILTLSTCQLYQKGFVLAYAGTPLMDEVNQLIPFITKAYIAGRTRDMAKQCVEIIRLLAARLFKVCCMEQSVLDNILKEFLKLLAEMSVDKNMQQTGLSEQDEDTDDGSLNTALPEADLVVDRETFDKLKESTSEEGNIAVRCEDEVRGEGPGDDGQKGATNVNGQDEDASDRPDENSKVKGNKTETDKKEESDDSDQDPDNAASDHQEGNPHPSEDDGHVQMDGVTGDGANTPQSSVDNTITEAMNKAEERTTERAKTDLNNMAEDFARERKERRREVHDNHKPITAEDVRLPKDIHFQEKKRKYPLSEQLPPVVREKGRTLYRKNLRYFKSLSTPNLTHRETGSVDPSRIFGLSIGETDIFRKNGVDKKFDGCAYVLIDNSGSMQGEKRHEACTAAAIIEEGFHGLIPVKIVAFDWQGQVQHEEIKGWEEQRNQNCSWNFCVHECARGGNADGYDIQIAHQELMRRPERKKLLVVLSDGMPTGCTEEYTKGAIVAARKSGIWLSGIFFGDQGEGDGFEGMYEKDYIICSPDEVEKHLSDIFRKFAHS